jgi:DNA-binding CsgD family transcriptional regulator
MAELRKADFERLLAFVGDAHTVGGPEPFTTELLDRLAQAMQSEFATYLEFDVESPTAHPAVTVVCSRSQRYTLPPWPHRRESPAPEWAVRPPGDVVLWSDRLERAARWQFEGMPPWVQTREIVDCACMTAPAGGSERGAVALFRQERDFTERDRWVLAALSPHVRALIQNARARRRLVDLSAVVDAEPDEPSRGYVLLGGRLEVEHASSAARRILASWFDNELNRLPMLIEEWLRSGERRTPLDLKRNGTRLVVEAPTARALVLSEESVIPATLTPREREVLRLLGAGKPTIEIARELWITPATVSKHLHHIYRKLGVTSRTAALAATSRYDLKGSSGGLKSSSGS